MNRLPSASTRCAPSPRIASETSGCWALRSPSGAGRHHQRGRVELDELDVGDDRAGPQRERDAVAGGHGRVGGRRVHLAHAAGGEHHRARQDRADAVLGALAEHVQRDAAGPAVGVAQQVEHERVLDQPDPRIAQDRGVQRPLHLGAGRVAAGVHDPVGVVAALPGQHQRAVAGAGRTRRPSASARVPGPGPR